MKRTAVFVATTGGPVRVERITRERAPQSMVCLKRTSTVLPISAAYDSFVRPGSGVIERVFGPFEDGAFRLDVSAPIESGESWQLGFFVAHALEAAPQRGFLGTEENAEDMIWLTGHVDYDLAVGPVGHLAEKIHASRTAISGWLADGRAVTMFVREGTDYDAVVAAGVPAGAQLVAIRSASETLAALNLPIPTGVSLVPKPPVRARGKRVAAGLAAAFAVMAIAAFSLSQWPNVTEKPTLAVASAPVEKPVSPRPIAQIAMPPASEPAAPSLDAPKLLIFERRAPVGRTCADVQFGAVAAIKIPVTTSDSELGARALHGLCGVSVAVDNGGRPQFVAVNLDVVSGKLLYGTDRPDRFGGQAAFGGKQEWAIDLPRRLTEPFEIRATAVSGPRAVSSEAGWLKAQPDASVAAKDLSAKGFATAMVRYRVVPEESAP